MLQRVYEGARTARSLRQVLVATDDERIAEACRAFGAPVVMTSPTHPTGTDRIAEVARNLEDEIVVNIQGDEPLIEGAIVDRLVETLEASPEAPMATLVHSAPPEALGDPNRVKVVIDRSGYALYFSRSAIPALRHPDAKAPLWQHIGIYAYRRPFLLEFVDLPQTAAERSEGLEQLRALENGFRIRVAAVDGWQSIPVDEPLDIERVEAVLEERAKQGDPDGR